MRKFSTEPFVSDTNVPYISSLVLNLTCKIVGWSSETPKIPGVTSLRLCKKSLVAVLMLPALAATRA
jgi:hypothetical protein